MINTEKTPNHGWNCPKCGCINSGNSNRCSQCGRTLREAQDLHNKQALESKLQKKMKRAFWLFTGLILLLFIATCVVIILYAPEKINELDKLKGNPRKDLSDLKIGARAIAYVLTPLSLLIWCISSIVSYAKPLTIGLSYLAIIGICGLLFQYLSGPIGTIIVYVLGFALLVGILWIVSLICSIGRRDQTEEEILKEMQTEIDFKRDLKNEGVEYVNAKYYKDDYGTIHHWYD